MSSTKELAEHREVVQAIACALGVLCVTYKTGRRETVSFKHQTHLVTPLKGTLRPEVDDQRIIEALFPTPAVGGVPLPAAMEFLKTYEGFDRGWFSGNIGWLTLEEACMTVGIRSGLVDRSTVSLYAGAGIVNGSDPRVEWEETGLKMKNMQEAVRGL